MQKVSTQIIYSILPPSPYNLKFIENYYTDENNCSKT